ncbi:MAG TPA: ABC transporter substrate-binding protein [Methylomirabilota bacterium]|nr:ABC transporter substrate-binding protein [Methylomirabilota bacterium]
MNWFHVKAALLAVGLAVTAVGPAAAGVPTDQLRGAVDRVLKTLEDPSLKGEGKVPERRVAVRKIANEIFDFGEIAKRSMARHWQPLSEAQRNEFVGLFADLLERSYISKIETYGGEKIQYTAERVDGDYATVSTRIITKNGTEVPVDYRMIKRSDRWLVYDVSIEGVSLVSNYRTQFNKIIQTSSYNELVSKLKNKQDELLAEDKGQKKKKL